jgi:excinuclease ABC subunit C
MAIEEKLRGVPREPGCYLFKDAKGDVLYVGKALSLRQRVRSYFQKSARHTPKIARMVAKVEDVECMVTDTELEALVLECNLIKRHRPPYNVRLRDDKSYPYIAVTMGEMFPRVLFTRQRRRGGTRYFGPFTSAFAVRDTLRLLHKLFPLIPCQKVFTNKAEQRPCLYYHLGQCLGPCAGLSDRGEYKRIIRDVVMFLEGRQEELAARLRREMDEAAEAMDFERAAALRDKLVSIEAVLQRQKVVSEEMIDQDVVAIVKDERGACVQMFYVRNGKLVGQRSFFLDGSKEESPELAVQEFVKQFYAESPEVPRELLLPVEIEERKIVQQWLRQRRGSAVTVTVPGGGEKLKLVEMAATNAELALTDFRSGLAQKEAWAGEATTELQEALALEEAPVRIEAYDISNIQGTAPTGSMVVMENGEAAKDQYRRFRIRMSPEKPDDFAMMREVILRRLRAAVEGDEKFARLPDLMVIDGGKGQLNAALKAMEEIELRVPAVGLAKRQELVFRPGEREPLALPDNSAGLQLLRRLRDEAHRFALSYHRKLRGKRAVGSVLEEIPGVGPRRRRLLLRTFGSVAAIREASIEALAAVPTMTEAMARRVKEHLREA